MVRQSVWTQRTPMQQKPRAPFVKRVKRQALSTIDCSVPKANCRRTVSCLKRQQKRQNISKVLPGMSCSRPVQRSCLLLKRIFPRVLPTLDGIRACEALDIPHRNIIAMQGPFSLDLNRVILEQFNIQWLVTKDGGAVGGFMEKAKACEYCGAHLLVLRRPRENGETVESILERCRELL